MRQDIEESKGRLAVKSTKKVPKERMKQPIDYRDKPAVEIQVSCFREVNTKVEEPNSAVTMRDVAAGAKNV